jgi:DNA phosphorothioation-dependent restriction protein DptG
MSWTGTLHHPSGSGLPSRMSMTQILIAARAALILWVNLAVMPAEFVFDSIGAELKRRGVHARTRSSRDGG